MSKHTPGPWTWGDGWDKPHNLADWDEHEKYMDMALVGAGGQMVLPLRIDHHHAEWDVGSSCEPPEEADRRLIAAAPDMYEALKEIDKGCYSHTITIREMQRIARAAIAKAETP